MATEHDGSGDITNLARCTVCGRPIAGAVPPDAKCQARHARVMTGAELETYKTEQASARLYASTEQPVERERAVWSVEALRCLRELARCKHDDFETNGENGDELWCVVCGAVHDGGWEGAGYPLPVGGWRLPTQVHALIVAYQGKARR